MADRRSPAPGVRGYERFRQIDVQRFSNLDRDARNHVIGRNQAVAEVLCVLSLLRNAGLVSRDAVPVGEGARFQSLAGSRALATEGAHCLPCQLAILGHATPLEMLLPNRDTQHYVKTLFGHVTHLPRAFNVADTAAEAVDGGRLIEAFVAAARDVIQRPRAGQAPEIRLVRGVGANFGELERRAMWPISRDVVRGAYEHCWKPSALLAYDRARAEVRTTGKYLSGADDPDQVVAILTAYVRHHDMAPSRLLDSQVDAIELRFNESTPAPAGAATGPLT